jgi:hypothetical protein
MTCKGGTIMTFKDNFVVEVKCNGKILRPRDGAVYLPFGSEYSIFLKNLNSRKASVKISVDGQDALDYSSLILEPNSSTELEGFLSGTVARNKFKFIKKTKEVQDHRGDKVDDGMIRVEFAFEKPKPETRQIITEKHEHHHHHYDYYHWWPRWTTFRSFDSGDIVGSSGDSSKGSSGDSVTYTSSMDSNIQMSNTGGAGGQQLSGEVRACFSNVVQDSLGVESLGQPLDDEGITVKGSECHQQFRYGSIGELEQSQVIVISLKGFGETGTTIEKPITVKDKLTCSSCGTKSKSSYKFCPNCGTFLE